MPALLERCGRAVLISVAVLAVATAAALVLVVSVEGESQSPSLVTPVPPVPPPAVTLTDLLTKRLGNGTHSFAENSYGLSKVPGVYVTDGISEDGLLCSWERRRSNRTFNGYEYDEDRIDSGFVDGPTAIRVQAEDPLLRLRGGCSWQLVS